MQLSCIHCGKPFTISRDQLGGTGRCPHCSGEIRLPKAADQTDEQEEHAAPVGHWWENWISGLVSVVMHMLILLILALISYDATTGEGLGETVMIGNLPAESLSDSGEEELSFEEESEQASEQELEEIEVETPVVAESESAFAELTEPTTLSGRDRGSFDLGAVAIGGGSTGGGGGWDGLLQNLRRDGLDIVITFDSTGSMGGPISQVKSQIQRIGGTLLKLVPKARISVCTYRDQGDEYVVRGLPLTGNIQEIDQYLDGVEAADGGDTPEAVHEGLRWAVSKNQFRGNARKVILLFGDAPPHLEFRDDCLRIVSDFHRQQKGITSTVTCGRPGRMREFEAIANMGGGEAFRISDEREIMTELLILVFGSRYRGKVLEAFELMER